MTIKDKRIFNYRPMCFFALALIVGIVVGESLYGEPIGFILLPIFVFALAFVLLCIFKRSRKFLYIPLAFIVGFASISIANASYDSHLIETYDGEFSVQVSSEVIVADGKTTFYGSNIVVDDNGVKYDVLVSINEELDVNFNAGDTVKLSGKLKPISHSKFDTWFATQKSKGIAYNAYVSFISKTAEGKPPFPTNLQMSIKSALFENADSHTAQICQALILGDKQSFDDTLYSNIKASGLAHVLAVSGLHISALASAVYFLLKKMRVNPKISFAIVTALTFLYSMLCSFTASSLRACIMSGVYMFSSSFGQKRDDLSALSFSAILILVFRPTALMEVGFLLSFYAVLGIFLFNKTFEDVGMKVVDKISPKRHIGKRFAKVVAVSYATNIMTYPLVAYFFKEVPTLFVLSNFLILPYIMVVYVILLVLMTLCLVTRFGGFVWIMKFLLLPFRAYVGTIGSLSFATIPVSIGIGGIVIFSVAMLLLSKYVFLSRGKKLSAVTIFSSFGMVLSAIFVLL